MKRRHDRGSKQTRDFIKNATIEEVKETIKALEQVQQDRKNGKAGSKLTKQISDRVIIMRVGDLKKELKKRKGAAINGN